MEAAPPESGVVEQRQDVVLTQLPDNPQTIAATTSIETLKQLLYDNWVYKATFEIDKDHQPGHVFGVLRIHPADSNQWNAHVLQMFRTWTGGMLVRARFGANALFGGVFRMGFLPPWFTYDEIQSGLDLATLTSFPNVDLDPKAQGWMHFEAHDERRMMFHLNKPIDQLTPDDFGGWIIFYVVTPLVQSLTTSSVPLAIEVAGKFEYAQPKSIGGPTPPPTPGGILSGGACRYINTQQLCDCYTTDPRNALLLVQSGNRMIDGFVLSYATGGRAPNDIPGTRFGDPFPSRRAKLISGDLVMVGGGMYDVEGDKIQCVTKHDTQMTACSLTDTYAFAADNVGAISKIYVKSANYDSTFRLDDIHFKLASSPNGTTVGGFGNDHNANNPPNPAVLHTGPVLRYSSMAPTEAMVYFGNATNGEFSMQTKSIALDLKASSPLDNTMSHIYTLHKTGGSGPLMTLRLCPNGMFTTSPTTKDIVVPMGEETEFYLQFLQAIPITTPLPQASLNYSTFRACRYAQEARGEGATMSQLSSMAFSHT